MIEKTNSNQPVELNGLYVRIDKVEYRPELPSPDNRPYPFVYFVTIHNDSDSAVVLEKRKWVISDQTAHMNVIEGDGIVGQTPRLLPGEQFSYNSYHVVSCNSTAEGSYHGITDDGIAVFVRIPSFKMNVPS